MILISEWTKHLHSFDLKKLLNWLTPQKLRGIKKYFIQNKLPPIIKTACAYTRWPHRTWKSAKVSMKNKGCMGNNIYASIQYCPGNIE